MRAFVSLASAVLFATASMVAAEQTWAGQISDSACGAKHESGAENVPTPPDRECTENCVRGGSTYVLVSSGKVFNIANQKDPALATHAGHKVRLTGELKGDSITVSKIEMQ